jgi:hypothetical protein
MAKEENTGVAIKDTQTIKDTKGLKIIWVMKKISLLKKASWLRVNIKMSFCEKNNFNMTQVLSLSQYIK